MTPEALERRGPPAPTEIPVAVLLEGCGPWREVGPREPCGACGRAVRAPAVVCLRCLTVAPKGEAILDAKRRKAHRATARKPPPKFQPKAPPASVLTARERRWASRQARKTPQGRRWADRIGLT